MSRILPVVLLFLFLSLPAVSESISVTGNLDPDDPNDVFILEFTLLPSSTLLIQSWGYGGGINAAGVTIPPGGFDAWLSLFQGTGPDAVFLLSDDDSGCPPAGGPPCGDPRLELPGPAPGPYTLTLTTFGNMSFAENYGGGILADGFVGMGSYLDWRTGEERSPAFALDLSGMDDQGGEIPEPSTGLLGSSIFLILVIARQHLGKEVSRL